MNGFRDRAQDALRHAEAPALQRIRDDAKTDGLPSQVVKLLEVLLERLYDSRLNVGNWRRWAGVRDNGVSQEFQSWFSVSMKEYYFGLRLETAARMLVATGLHERLIGRTVGFTSYRSFERHYRNWIGCLPGEGRERPAPTIGPAMLLKMIHGDLAAEEVHWLVAEVYRLHPHVAAHPSPEDGASGQPPVRQLIDGSEWENFQVEQVWQRIRTLPFEEQRRQLRGCRCRSTVLFDLLRKKSREEGRKDRQRGVDLARLALVSLEGHDAIFGDRIHDLRALGWAWLANARCLQLDFEGAEADLATMHTEWSTPRTKDLDVAAEIHFLESAIRMCQRRYPEALEKANESIRVAKLTSNAVGQAKALTIRASVKGYMERLQESATDLRQAAVLIENENEPFLAFMINLNQGNVYVRLGAPDTAVTSLAKAMAYCRELEYPLGRHQIEHVKGNLYDQLGDAELAEVLYLDSLQGFLSAQEPNLAVLVSLDLAVLDSQRGKHDRAFDLAIWSLPILQSMKLHEETATAIELLARESAVRRVDQTLLAEVARLLSLDPLVRLGQRVKAENVSRPPCLRF